MAVVPLKQEEDPILKMIAEKVKNFRSVDLLDIISNMVDTMRSRQMVGLSAPQIGKPIQVFVTEIKRNGTRENISDFAIDGLRIFINPDILELSDEKEVKFEGCGSVRDSNFFVQVERSKRVTLKLQNITGGKFFLNAEGLLARAIQHENDHLRGILILNKIFDSSIVFTKEEMMAHREKNKT